MIDDQDSISSHVDDTPIAGAGLCDQMIVEHVVSGAREAINWLIAQGVAFTKAEESFHLTRECGHYHRRILHTADATGWAIQDALDRRASATENINCHHTFIVVDLCFDQRRGPRTQRVCGCYVLNKCTGEKFMIFIPTIEIQRI